jgi:solute carrier family 35 protein F1/2
MEIKTKDVWSLLLVLFLGQLVAFSMAAASFASSLVANLGTIVSLA